MNKIVITVNDSSVNTAGPKAKVDVEKILKERGFSVLNFNIDVASKIDKLKNILFTIPKIIKHCDGDEIVFQYPPSSAYIMRSFIRNIRKYTQARLILFIHDIESLRLHRGERSFIDEEVNILNSVDGIISHNESMTDWLINNGVKKPIVNLNIFDYLNPQNIIVNNLYTGSVCFAGNLAKASFLERVNWQKHSLDIFGPNKRQGYPRSIHYRGVYPPNELPKFLKDNFGLVWDGSSIDSCNGLYGEYMKFNNPHKVSLYLSCGIPVIIWSQSALSHFVKEKKVGIVVNSLSDVERKLENLTSDSYKELHYNALKLSKKLRKGYFTNYAIDNIENILDNNVGV